MWEKKHPSGAVTDFNCTLIYANYLGVEPELGKKYRSPFRDDGNVPSLSFFMSGGKLKWTDFGNISLREDVVKRGRDSVSFVMQAEDITEQEALEYIRTLGLKPSNQSGKIEIRSFNRDIDQNEEESETIVTARGYWRTYEVNYWKHCDLSLIHKSRIYPLDSCFLKGRKDKTISSEPLSPAFCYLLNEDPVSWKIYRPKEATGKWYSHNLSGIIEGWHMLPQYKIDDLIITSSRKDSIVTQTNVENVHCINPANENVWSAILEKAADINKRARRIWVWLDADDTGTRNTINVCNISGWHPIILGGEYKTLGMKDQFDIAAKRGGFYLKKIFNSYLLQNL